MYKHLVKAYHNKAEVRYTKEDLKKSAMLTYYVSEMYKDGIRNMNLAEKIKDFINSNL